MTLSDDVGSTRHVQEQRALAEVVSWVVPLDDLGWLAWLEHLGGNAFAFDDHEELVAILVAFSDDEVSRFVPVLLESVSQLGPLLLLHALEDLYLVQEVVVLLSLLLDSCLDDVVESVAVE